MTTRLRTRHQATVTVAAPAADVRQLLRTPEQLPTVIGRLQNVRRTGDDEAEWTMVAPGAANVRRTVRMAEHGTAIGYEAVDGPVFRITIDVAPRSARTCAVRVAREAAVGGSLAERLDALVFVPWLAAADAARVRETFA
jgi:uncharacterized membrane protein